MLGHDGSLLAVSNRAGDLAFWTYGSERRFKRDQLVALADDWVTHMAWSGWHVQADGSCLAHLALALTNGYVGILPVRRTADVASKTWKTEIGSLINIDSSSKRAVTAIAWVNSALIWTKSGTVHLRIAPGTSGYAWSGVREIRLGAAGGWASATGLGTCVGEHPTVFHISNDLVFLADAPLRSRNPEHRHRCSSDHPIIIDQLHHPRLAYRSEARPNSG